MNYEEVNRHPDRLPMDREVIFYCTCPNDAGAAEAAAARNLHEARNAVRRIAFRPELILLGLAH